MRNLTGRIFYRYESLTFVKKGGFCTVYKIGICVSSYSTAPSSSVFFLPNKINSNGEKLDIIAEKAKLFVKE